jgi:hypothetical protein
VQEGTDCIREPFKYLAETQASSRIKIAQKKAMYFAGRWNNARTPHIAPQRIR